MRIKLLVCILKTRVTTPINSAAASRKLCSKTNAYIGFIIGSLRHWRCYIQFCKLQAGSGVEEQWIKPSPTYFSTTPIHFFPGMIMILTFCTSRLIEGNLFKFVWLGNGISRSHKALLNLNVGGRVYSLAKKQQRKVKIFICQAAVPFFAYQTCA